MTGEMSFIDQNGQDSNGECWEIHAAIAQALGGELKPFDSYQGPYIVIGNDLIVDEYNDYRIPIQGLGIIRLWIIGNEDDPMFPSVYREDNETQAEFYIYDTEWAIDAAKSLL